MPDGWRPRWVIPQGVVLKDKDKYKATHTGKPAKTRCVCDLRQLNAHFRDGGMQYTGTEHFAAQLAPGDYISVVDIASHYLKIPLATRMYKFFAFRDYFVPGRLGWFTSTSLPFGAGLSPY